MLTDHIFHCIFSLQGSWIFRRERDRHRAREAERERDRQTEREEIHVPTKECAL